MDFSSNEFIDNYLLNYLSTSDKVSFEQALATDTKLANKVKARKELLAVVDDMGDLLLLDRIKSIAAKIDATPPIQLQKKRNPFLSYAAAAIMLLLLTVSYFAFIRPPLHERLYATHYTIYQIDNLRNANQEGQNAFQIGWQAYQTKDYQQAATAFESIQNNNLEAKMALGICYLEIGQAQKAIQQFKQLETTAFSNMALWYQGLAYLKMNQLDKSLPYFERLIAAESDYANRAQSIENQIIRQINKK